MKNRLLLLFSAIIASIAHTSLAMEPSDPNHDTVILVFPDKQELSLKNFSRNSLSTLGYFQKMRKDGEPNQKIYAYFPAETMRNLDLVLMDDPKKNNLTKDQARSAYAAAYFLDAPYEKITAAADIYIQHLWHMSVPEINEDVKKVTAQVGMDIRHCARKFIYDGINNGLKARNELPVEFDEQTVNTFFERGCRQVPYTYKTGLFDPFGPRVSQRPEHNEPFQFGSPQPSSSSSQPGSTTQAAQKKGPLLLFIGGTGQDISDIESAPYNQLGYIYRNKDKKSIDIPYTPFIFDSLSEALSSTSTVESMMRQDVAEILNAAIDLSAPVVLRQRLARIYLSKMPAGLTEQQQNVLIKKEIASHFHDQYQAANSEAAQGFVRNQRSLLKEAAQRRQPAPAQQQQVGTATQPRPSLWQRFKNWISRSK